MKIVFVLSFFSFRDTLGSEFGSFFIFSLTITVMGKKHKHKRSFFPLCPE